MTDIRYTNQFTSGALGGIIHVISVAVFIALYVTSAGHTFSLSSFVGRGGVPIAVLFLLGAVCSLLYFNYNLISPIMLLVLFDISAVIASAPEGWTETRGIGPPSFYTLYIFFFVGPLGVILLMGTIEHWTRTRWEAEATNHA